MRRREYTLNSRMPVCACVCVLYVCAKMRKQKRYIYRERPKRMNEYLCEGEFSILDISP
jgi:hypothetical protein